MSVSTKVYVVKQHGIDEFMFEVVKALKKAFGGKLNHDSIKWRNCITTYAGYIFHEIDFTLNYKCKNLTNNENRSISIFNFKGEMQRDFYQLNFNAFGHNVDIAKCLVDYFGGYADYSDCDEIEVDYCKSQPDSVIGVLK